MESHAQPVVCLESEILKIKDRAWGLSVLYWLKIKCVPTGLLQLSLANNFISLLIKAIQQNKTNQGENQKLEQLISGMAWLASRGCGCSFNGGF